MIGNTEVMIIERLASRSYCGVELSRLLNLTPSRVNQCMKNLERHGLTKTSHSFYECVSCRGSKVAAYGVARACFWCKGSGKIRKPEYPIYWKLTDWGNEISVDLVKGVQALRVIKEKAKGVPV